MQGILDSLVDHGAVGALARFQDDERTWAGSSGVTELGIERPVAAHGSFRIGSVTKAFTATVLLQLVVEGALRLEDSVDSWLPGLIPDGGAITVGHLVRHTSGLHNYTDDMSDAAVVLQRRFSPHSPDEIVTDAARRPRLFPVGAKRSYSNTNGEFSRS